MSDLQKLLSLLFLRSAPQDLGYSSQLTMQLSVAYFLTGVLVLQTTLSPEYLVFGLMLGYFVQYAFTYLVLSALDRRPRFMQTFCAIIGVSMIFNLISWPVFSVMADASAAESMKASMSLLFLMLISWEVLVKAYVFKHALEVKMFSALALSFSLFFIAVTLAEIFIPTKAVG